MLSCNKETVKEEKVIESEPTINTSLLLMERKENGPKDIDFVDIKDVSKDSLGLIYGSDNFGTVIKISEPNNADVGYILLDSDIVIFYDKVFPISPGDQVVYTYGADSLHYVTGFYNLNVKENK